MAYSEIYTRVNWADEPDTSTPLDAENLNKMDIALKAFDLLIKEIGNNAMYAADVANALYGQPTINQETGVITFPKKDGGFYTLDTLLEKVVVNFDFNETTQVMTITLEDGTTKTVNLSSFITETEYDDSSTIDFSVSNHRVTANVKPHSIGATELQQDYLADCQDAKDDAEDAADSAVDDALKAEGHAVGTQNGTPVGPDSEYYNNNAKYYSERAEAIAGHSFGGLTDVSFENLQSGQAALYNSATQTWHNGFVNLPVDPVNTTGMNVWIETQ